VILLVRLWARLMRRLAQDAAPWRQRAARITVPALLALLATAAELFLAWEVNVSGPVFDVMAVLASVAIFGAAAWAAWLAIWLLVELIIASPRIPDDSYDANLLRLLARIGSAVAVAVVLVFGANTIGVPVLGLVAGVSVGGIAFALAAQSTVENLFGGLSIFADRPFRVGDFIRYGSSSGTVEAVGPRSTRIRGQDGTLTTVPNADLAKTHITNFAARPRFLFQHRLRIGAGTPAAAVAALVATLRSQLAACAAVESEPALPRAHAVGLGEGTIEIELFAHVRAASLAEFLHVQEALLLAALAAATADGIALPDAAPGQGAPVPHPAARGA
jgi:MscS family membrane protein